MERVYYQRYLTRLRVDGPERVSCVGLPFVSMPNASAKRRRRKKRRGLWEGLREGHVTQPSSTGLPLLLLLLHHHQNSTGLTHLSLGSHLTASTGLPLLLLLLLFLLPFVARGWASNACSVLAEEGRWERGGEVICGTGEGLAWTLERDRDSWEGGAGWKRHSVWCCLGFQHIRFVRVRVNTRGTKRERARALVLIDLGASEGAGELHAWQSPPRIIMQLRRCCQYIELLHLLQRAPKRVGKRKVF